MRAFFLALCIVGLSSPWVIYRRNHKKKLVCKEDASNSTAPEESSEESSSLSATRRRRDIEVDPVSRQPIIYLGGTVRGQQKGKRGRMTVLKRTFERKNKTSKVHDDDFDLVSDQLSEAEIEEVKQQIRETCIALKIT